MITFVRANLLDLDHSQAIVSLLDEYASSREGGGESLSDISKQRLPQALAQRSFCHIVLAYHNEKPAGLAICFESFSTFSCKAILNIHDFMIASQYRGQGLSKKLLKEVEILAQELDCCKITLEVLENNKIARNAYHSCGFNSYELKPEFGRALFYEKKLATH